MNRPIDHSTEQRLMLVKQPVVTNEERTTAAAGEPFGLPEGQRSPPHQPLRGKCRLFVDRFICRFGISFTSRPNLRQLLISNQPTRGDCGPEDVGRKWRHGSVHADEKPSLHPIRNRGQRDMKLA